MCFGRKKGDNKRSAMSECKRKEETLRQIRCGVDELIRKIPELKRCGGSIIIPYFVAIDIPGTKNEAYLRINGMREDVSFQVSVVRKGTTRANSHYLFRFSHANIEDSLRNEIDYDEIYTSIKQLSEKTDEYYEGR